MRKLINRLRCDDGQALVELAFVLPLLLLFLFGIIDFGLALNQQNQDTNMANIAVREAAIIGTNTSATCNGTSESTLYAWTLCEAGQIGAPTPTSVCVYDTSSGGYGTTYSTGDPVEVKVGSSFGWMKLITGQVGNLSSTLGANATMREEGTIGTSGPTSNSFLSNPKEPVPCPTS